MANDVYVFGDSHWRVFFPFVNHAVTTGTHDAVIHAQTTENGEVIRTIDTTGNGLSGSTMWGLLNPLSRNHARKTIIDTLDSLGGTKNVALVFGEVDARYHFERYFHNGILSSGKILELIARYVRFIQEDLILSNRVTDNIFVYHGFAYPQEGGWPGSNPESQLKAEAVNHIVSQFLGNAFMDMPIVKPIIPGVNANGPSVVSMVSADAVHLEPKIVYEKYTLPAMAARFSDGYRPRRESSF